MPVCVDTDLACTVPNTAPNAGFAVSTVIYDSCWGECPRYVMQRLGLGKPAGRQRAHWGVFWGYRGKMEKNMEATMMGYEGVIKG